MAIRTEKIQSLSKFLEIVEGISMADDTIWFRGHESIDYKLSPSIYRAPYSSKNEIEFYAKFKSRAIPFLKYIPPETDYWSWLFLMQHHNVPTRLLDWSTGAMHALAFAILFRNSSLDDKDAVVWCLLPKKLNHEDRVKLILDEHEAIPNVLTNASKIKGPYNYKPDNSADYPIAITGPLNSNRIAAQKGTFTLFPNKTSFNLEDKPDAGDFLVKIVIDHEQVPSIKKQLILLGITETSIYPELNSLGAEIKREFQS